MIHVYGVAINTTEKRKFRCWLMRKYSAQLPHVTEKSGFQLLPKCEQNACSQFSLNEGNSKPNQLFILLFLFHFTTICRPQTSQSTPPPHQQQPHTVNVVSLNLTSCTLLAIHITVQLNKALLMN